MDDHDFKQRDAESYSGDAAHYERYIRRLGARLATRICDLAQLQDGDRVLDVGTGTGLAARVAAVRVAPLGHVVGIDLSSAMVQVATQLNAGLNHAPTYQVMDAESLEFAPSSFDVVTSLCAVSHFPDIGAAAEGWHRILVPRGRLVVSSGSVRPLARWPLALHHSKQLARIALQPLRPILKAPNDLVKIVSGRIPHEEHAVGTAWGARSPHRTLVSALRAAGFTQLESSWLTYEVEFDSADEFWEAQAAIATAVRKRLHARPDLTEGLRAEYVSRAQRVLDRGGRLIYPYGAFFVRAVRAAV